MAVKKKQEEQEPGAPMWMMTYADMMTLLLTFFILLLSFSTLDNRRLKVAIGSLKGAFGILQQQPGVLSTKPTVLTPPIPEVNYPEYSRQMAKKRQLMKLKDKVEDKVVSSKVDHAITDEGIVLTVLDSVLFQPGQAVLLDSAHPLLAEIASIIASVDADVEVGGHTDDTPLSVPGRSRFGNNWELSSARAMSVLDYFINTEGLDPSRFSVAGYAQYQPRSPNDTPEGRRRNRRVDITLKPVDIPPESLQSPFLPGQEPIPSDDLPHALQE